MSQSLSGPRSWVVPALVCLASAWAAHPLAAQEGLPNAAAIVTGFSGHRLETDAGGLARRVIDTDGPTAQAFDLSAPGRAADGSALRDAPELFRATASGTGQVFGVALDTAPTPAVYLAATSAFGLHRTADNRDWMEGMWGPEGGPGTIWKLDPANGYAPEFFARVTLDGRLDTGAALGNVAYDPWHLQIFVSDLETGMIHRLQGRDGLDLGHCDHGTEGRPDFFDAVAGARDALAPVAFDPASAARVADCSSGEFARDPSCWNLADFRRRVWGLGVHREGGTGEVRLYYAVWSSQGFGAPEFFAAPEDERRNTVWSVALSEDGGFDIASVRREFILPDFFRATGDIARAGFSHPVSDIAFAVAGGTEVMLLAERGGMRNLGLGADDAFAAPHEARVLRYVRAPDGSWQPDGRHDLGFQDRAARGTPYIRANAAGGVVFGPGYDAAGLADPLLPDGMVWMTGDALCAAAGPCPDGTGADGAELHGLQGSPATALAEVAPAAAFAPYPVPGPATPPDGPAASHMVEIASGRDASWTGDVALHQSVPGLARLPDLIPWWPYDPPPPPPPGRLLPELAVDKSGPAVCEWGRLCPFMVTVTNTGPGVWDGPIVLADAVLAAPDYGFFDVSPGWTCDTRAALLEELDCVHDPVTLAPGDSVTLIVTVAFPFPPGGVPDADIVAENCAGIGWLPFFPAGTGTDVMFAELWLVREGYPHGPVDGVLDPASAAGVAAVRVANGLPPGGVDAALLAAMYPGSIGMAGDANPDNDGECVPFILPGEGHVPPPPAPRDLAVGKEALDPVCTPGGLCNFRMVVANAGAAPLPAQVVLEDFAWITGRPLLPAASLLSPGPVFACASGGSGIQCRPAGPPGLASGAARNGPLSVFVPAGAPAIARLNNCVRIDWAAMGLPGWDLNPGNDFACAIAFFPAVAVDLAVGSETTCVRGQSCSFEAWIENVSEDAFSGAVGFEGTLDPALPLTSVEAVTPGLACSLTGAAEYQCSSASLTLPPSVRARARITAEVPADFAPDRVRHLKEMLWPDPMSRDGNDKSDRHVSVIEIVDPAAPPEPEPEPAPAGAAELALAKLANQGSCTAGGPCVFSISVTNRGDGAFAGALTITDTGSTGLSLVGYGRPDWPCAGAGGQVDCTIDMLALAPGEEATFSVTLATGADARGILTNCAAINWAGPVSVAEVQQALNEAGFNAGIVDGIAGPQTRAAIRAFQAAAGLDGTGQIDPSFLAALLGRDDVGDGTPDNDAGCVTVNLIAPTEPPVVTPEPEPEPPVVIPPAQDDTTTPPAALTCPQGFRQVTAAQAALLRAQGRAIRVIGSGGQTIVCAGPAPAPEEPALQCPQGFRQVSAGQAAVLGRQGFEIREVGSGGNAIFCARRSQQPPGQVTPPGQGPGQLPEGRPGIIPLLRQSP